MPRTKSLYWQDGFSSQVQENGNVMMMFMSVDEEVGASTSQGFIRLRRLPIYLNLGGAKCFLPLRVANRRRNFILRYSYDNF